MPPVGVDSGDGFAARNQITGAPRTRVAGERRHGFDADHLATIDGLTRYNARANPRLARMAGALFSLGHGVVVLLVALVAGVDRVAHPRAGSK